MLQQNTPDWLEMRKNRIGASDAPIIMGVSPYQTPYQLWESKLGLRDHEESYAMYRGKQLEEPARQAFIKMTGHIVLPAVVVHPERDWQMASLDGINFDETVIVEIKCLCRDKHELAKEGKVPREYYPQLQHQMSVCNLPMAYYFSFDGKDGVVIEVDRDDEYIEDMLKREWRFWDCVQRLEAPPLCDQDYVHKNDTAWIRAADEWKACHEELDLLRRKEEHLRAKLITLANKSNSQGAGVRLSKVLRKGNIDYGAIPNLAGVDLEFYRKKPVEYWKLSSI